jgi:hypothetical protein
MVARVQLKKSIFLSLKELDAKKNWLAVNCHSQSNFGFDFERSSGAWYVPEGMDISRGQRKDSLPGDN